MARLVLGAVVLGLALASAACSSDGAGGGGADAGGGGGDAAGKLRSTGLPTSCSRGPKSTAKPATCNGAEALCDRTYDRVAVPVAHNAMASAEAGFTTPNQTHGLARQLADGIRGLMLDLHYFDLEKNESSEFRIDDLSALDQVWLCHGPCLLGKIRLLDGLCSITSFLDQNPGEVVSIIFEPHVKDVDAQAVLEASGLAEYAYAHPAGQPWPTLRSMIDSGKRLVVFMETGGGAPPWMQPAFEGNIVDTPFSFERQSDFTCARNRGQVGSPLFLLNHWLTRPLADIAFAREVNAAAVLDARIATCTKEVGRPPTFVGVDFYEVGDLFAAVKKVNGL